MDSKTTTVFFIIDARLSVAAESSEMAGTIPDAWASFALGRGELPVSGIAVPPAFKLTLIINSVTHDPGLKLNLLASETSLAHEGM